MLAILMSYDSEYWQRRLRKSSSRIKHPELLIRALQICSEIIEWFIAGTSDRMQSYSDLVDDRIAFRNKYIFSIQHMT